MRHRVDSLFVLAATCLSLVVGGNVASGQAQDAARGAAALAEARRALGGEDRLAAARRLEVKGTVRRAGGNQSLEGDLELFIELPDKYRRNEFLSLGAVGGPTIDRVEVLNGAETWEETSGGNFPGRGGFGGDGGRGFGDGGGRGDGGRRGDLAGLLGGAAGNTQTPGQPAIDPERLKEAQRRNRQAELSRLLVGMLLATTGQVAWVGTAQSPDGNADVLEITPPEGQPMRLFLDSATHMPLMITWQGVAPRGGGAGRRGGGRRGGDQTAGPQGAQAPPPPEPGAAPPGQPQPQRGGGFGQPATIELHMSEYKAVNGIKLPHLITRGINGQTNEELEIKSYKINSNFKANTFTRK